MKKIKPKVKKKKDDFQNADYMKTTKDNIKNVIRDNNILSTINDIVIRTNKIVIHSYQFLHLCTFKTPIFLNTQIINNFLMFFFYLKVSYDIFQFYYKSL